MKKTVMLTRPKRHYSNPMTSTNMQVRGNKDGDQGPPGPPSSPKGEGRGVPKGSVPTAGSATVAQLLQMAAELKPAERKQVLDQLALQNQLVAEDSPTRSRDLDMWAGAVYEALRSTITPGEGAGYGLVPLRRQLAASASWGPVTEFMKDSKLATLKVVERQAVYVALARLLVQHARRSADLSGAPLTMRYVASVSASLPAIFDQAFPGYLRAGLALIVARRLCAGRAERASWAPQI